MTYKQILNALVFKYFEKFLNSADLEEICAKIKQKKHFSEHPNGK